MYSPEIRHDICRMIAQGMVVPEIARLPNMPDKTTIYGWLIDYPDFLDSYDIAKEKQMEVFGDMIIDIARSCPANVDAVAKAKLLIHTIQWTMGKIKPKKYGDSTTIKGDKDNPLSINLASALDVAIARRAAGLTIEHEPAASVPLMSQPSASDTDNEEN